LPQPTSERPPEAVNRSAAHQSLTPPSTAVSSAPAIAQPKATPAVVRPLAAERYKVQFTLSQETFEKLRRVQDLMRHACPSGDVGIVFERAVTLLLQHLEATKLAHVSRPQRPRGTPSGSRRVPSAVRRAVWVRDNGQCAFIGARGRCAERGFLEFHHVVPFADAERPSSTTFSCAVAPTTNTSRINCSACWGSLSCVSAATFRAGRTRSEPSRRASHIAATARSPWPRFSVVSWRIARARQTRRLRHHRSA
jgi:5-methylcytosine-specific restriction endonuclease McrA